MKKNKSFSALLTELIEVWLEWMKNNAICKNDTLTVKERARAAENCEMLIDRRYTILDQMDAYFQNTKKN